MEVVEKLRSGDPERKRVRSQHSSELLLKFKINILQ